MSRSETHAQRNDILREEFLKPFEFAASALPTTQTVPEVCRKVEIEHYVEDIPNSTHQAKLHWLGKRDARKTMLYFHGGGFCIPILEGHVKFLSKTIGKVKAKGVDLNVAVLEYAMAPVAKYPVQITQAAEALQFLLSRGHSSSNILIGGDSAGGNIALALLSIIKHGLPGVPTFNLDIKLAGALLISPATSYETNTSSFRTNAHLDIVGVQSTNLLWPQYVSEEQRDNYSEPIRANVAWWKDLPVNEILNVYGGHEVFKDDIVLIGERLKEAGNVVQTVECAGHIHTDAIVDEQSGLEEGEMAEVVWNWVGRVARL